MDPQRKHKPRDILTSSNAVEYEDDAMLDRVEFLEKQLASSIDSERKVYRERIDYLEGKLSRHKEKKASAVTPTPNPVPNPVDEYMKTIELLKSEMEALKREKETKPVAKPPPVKAPYSY